ncbi:hypothetical protein [Pseudoalteromonas luteoviolacea]|uniref:hypothetical protein n=1 Tax=Pseudoalteromonas luteoviolacea TaxID=43657 RepID=UPI001B35F2B8|nr:hypothetical protein [Pseudoalteromonas luteoviolacea]MBQ4839791.1 hypothetical protein [Pseudoalteromonas luteoviolacea]
MSEKSITFFGYVVFQCGSILISSGQLEAFAFILNLTFLVTLFLWLRPKVLSFLNQERLELFYKSAFITSKKSKFCAAIGNQISNKKGVHNNEAKELGAHFSASIMLDVLALSLCVLPVYIYRIFT